MTTDDSSSAGGGEALTALARIEATRHKLRSRIEQRKRLREERERNLERFRTGLAKAEEKRGNVQERSDIENELNEWKAERESRRAQFNEKRQAALASVSRFEELAESGEADFERLWGDLEEAADEFIDLLSITNSLHTQRDTQLEDESALVEELFVKQGEALTSALEAKKKAAQKVKAAKESLRKHKKSMKDKARGEKKEAKRERRRTQHGSTLLAPRVRQTSSPRRGTVSSSGSASQLETESTVKQPSTPSEKDKKEKKSGGMRRSKSVSGISKMQPRGKSSSFKSSANTSGVNVKASTPAPVRKKRTETNEPSTMTEVTETEDMSEDESWMSEEEEEEEVERLSPEEEEKMNTKRHRIAQEILETEKSYVDKLGLIANVIVDPLRAIALTDNRILSVEEIKKIFSDIKVILGYNTLLLGKIQDRMSSWTSDSHLGDIFLQMCAFLKSYTSYINNYEVSMATLSQVQRENLKFKNFLRRQNVRKALGRDALSSFLILPIQRIPRYVMLLKDLVKNTYPYHSDKDSLIIAENRMESIAQHVDKMKEIAENTQKLVEIANNISRATNIVAPHRRFVREGSQFKSESRSPMNVFYFFVFSDMVIECKRKGQKQGANVAKIHHDSLDYLWECKRTFSIQECQLSHIDGCDFGWKILTPDHTYKIYSAHIEDKKSWMACLTDLKTKLVENQYSMATKLAERGVEITPTTPKKKRRSRGGTLGRLTGKKMNLAT